MILLLSERNISSSQNYETQNLLHRITKLKIFFTELRSSKSYSQNYEAQKLFLKECRAKSVEATKKVVLKGAQRKF
jgi:hypothetical protein